MDPSQTGCTTCSAGTYAPNGTVSCLECPKGKGVIQFKCVNASSYTSIVDNEVKHQGQIQDIKMKRV